MTTPKPQSKLTTIDWLLVVVGNITPLIGVLFFDWSLPQIVILYWIENLIIGFWNIPRILMAGEGNKLKNLPPSLFFIIHYGIFCSVHGTFIMALVFFTKGREFNYTDSMIAKIQDFSATGFILGVVIMFLSVGWDLYSSYLSKSQFKTWTIGKAMFYPYSHIVVVHLAIMIAGIIVFVLGSPLVLLMALIIGKTLIELKSRRKKLKSSPQVV